MKNVIWTPDGGQAITFAIDLDERLKKKLFSSNLGKKSSGLFLM